MTAPDFWLLDIRISGAWKPRPDHERTLEAARSRADTVFYWATMRARNAVTGECWVREAGRGWVKTDDVAPPQPIATSADPRRPLRHPAHATQPVPGPDGIPDEQLQWWQKN